MIEYYLKCFSKLRRDYKFGGAPHKPILLLSIIRLIKNGTINSNQIFITPELVLEFKDLWSKLVHTPHTPNFALPFYHLKTEPFWKLKTNYGKEIPVTKSHSIKSLKSLIDTIYCAEIDLNLFMLIKNDNSNQIENFLLKKYFSTDSIQIEKYSTTHLFKEIEEQILSEDKVEYQKRIHRLNLELSPSEYEEEIFIRGGVFKKEIPKIYSYQCAISKMRIETSRNVQMVDACHIVPFAISNNDTIQNGISLSPNLHRAFDRGIITINSDYIVQVSSKIKENDSVFSLIQFDGKKIVLPDNKDFWPLEENLIWHFENRFIG
jgi:putative restriction endonuclease